MTTPGQAFQVTDEAKRQLREIADGRKLEPGRYLRLAIPPAWTGDGEFGIVIDARGPGDISVSWEGRPVVLVERDVADQLAKSVLDFKETPAGKGFTLDIF